MSTTRAAASSTWSKCVTLQLLALTIQVKAQFKRRSTANNVEIYVPVPDDADSPKFRVHRYACAQSLTSQASVGTVHYLPEKSAFVWRIKQLGGGREYLMRAHFGLPSVKGDEAIENRAPITVRFEIPCVMPLPRWS